MQLISPDGSIASDELLFVVVAEFIISNRYSCMCLLLILYGIYKAKLQYECCEFEIYALDGIQRTGATRPRPIEIALKIYIGGILTALLYTTNEARIEEHGQKSHLKVYTSQPPSLTTS